MEDSYFAVKKKSEEKKYEDEKKIMEMEEDDEDNNDLDDEEKRVMEELEGYLSGGNVKKGKMKSKFGGEDDELNGTNFGENNQLYQNRMGINSSITDLVHTEKTQLANNNNRDKNVSLPSLKRYGTFSDGESADVVVPIEQRRSRSQSFRAIASNIQNSSEFVDAAVIKGADHLHQRTKWHEAQERFYRSGYKDVATVEREIIESELQLIGALIQRINKKGVLPLTRKKMLLLRKLHYALDELLNPDNHEQG